MLALIAAIVISPVQDRAISVADFIKSFDTETVKHVASKEMGEHIIFVHAPGETNDAIKEKLAETISASWRKTETGYRLERTQKQANDLARSENKERSAIFDELKVLNRKKLQNAATAESRANAALRSLIAFQEDYRSTRPTSFKPETQLPADWLLFAMLDTIDAAEIASVPIGEGIQRSNKPTGAQMPLRPGFHPAIESYMRDRREVSDFSDTILSQTADGPMSSWVEDQIEGIRKDQDVDRILFQYGRGSIEFNVGVFIYNSQGEIFDQQVAWFPLIKVKDRLNISTGLTAELNEVQFSFVDTANGYSFIRDPHPKGIDLIAGAEPLCAVEPLFMKLAEAKRQPMIAVLDDRLLDAVDRATGRIKNVGSFIMNAEDTGAISTYRSDSWLLLGPKFLLDAEARRFDRSAIEPFLASVRKAGYVTIEAHIPMSAASRHSYVPLPFPIYAQLDRSGYPLVREPNLFLPRASRFVRELLKLRGGIPKEITEAPLSSLPSSARNEVLAWARNGAAPLEARPGTNPSRLELNGNFALPNGLRADSVARLIPTWSGCVGLQEPVPNTYTAEELGWMCGGMGKPPVEVLAGPFWYGHRRQLRVEILLTPKAMLSNEYYESPGEMKEMRGYSNLPEEFRKQVEEAYKDARAIIRTP